MEVSTETEERVAAEAMAAARRAEQLAAIRAEEQRKVAEAAAEAQRRAEEEACQSADMAAARKVPPHTASSCRLEHKAAALLMRCEQDVSVCARTPGPMSSNVRNHSSAWNRQSTAPAMSGSCLGAARLDQQPDELGKAAGKGGGTAGGAASFGGGPHRDVRAAFPRWQPCGAPLPHLRPAAGAIRLHRCKGRRTSCHDLAYSALLVV